MGNKTYDFWREAQRLAIYLDENEGNCSRDQVREMMGDLTTAYFEWADAIDKVALDEVL
jgi:hypothetical protein